MDLIFNSLSLETHQDLPADESGALALLRQLTDLLTRYRSAYKCPRATILTKKSWTDWYFSQEYASINQLIPKLPQEYRGLLLNAFTKKPFLTDLPPYYYINWQGEQKETPEWGYAYERDAWVISYNTTIWNQIRYAITRLSEAEEESVVCVKHLLPSVLGDIDIFGTLKDSTELWQRRQELFPLFVFCGDTERQICSVSIRKLGIVFEKLMRLHQGVEQAATPKATDWEGLGISISPESQSTLEQYAMERTFELPEKNRSEVFSWHIKLGDWRIHFYADDELCYIGYIGKHLRTSKYS